MVRRNVLTVVGAAAMGLAMVMPALAATDSTSAEVTPGSLTISSIAVDFFASREVLATSQTTTAAFEAFQVTDLTGSAAGWHVTASASQFNAGGGLTLTPGSLSMGRPEVTTVGITAGDAPVVPGTGAITLDDGPVTIADADAGDGQGTYNFGATTLTLNLPALVREGTYNSTLTFDVIAGPVGPEE